MRFARSVFSFFLLCALCVLSNLRVESLLAFRRCVQNTGADPTHQEAKPAQPIVAVIAPGMMGSAVGQRLVENGIEVYPALGGRSARHHRARQSRRPMIGASDEQIVASDIIPSILPPGDAPAPPRRSPPLRAATKKPIFVDCNALNPGTVLRIARVIEETGATFVDGGIIGGPPKTGYSPKIYLSGSASARVAELAKFGLQMPIQPGPIGAASAMKMSYAGITKGFTALGAAMMLAATRAGTADDLRAELSGSQPALFGWLTRQLPGMLLEGLPLGRRNGRDRPARRRGSRGAAVL